MSNLKRYIEATDREELIETVNTIKIVVPEIITSKKLAVITHRIAKKLNFQIDDDYELESAIRDILRDKYGVKFADEE
jgi:hypothetical protein